MQLVVELNFKTEKLSKDLSESSRVNNELHELLASNEEETDEGKQKILKLQNDMTKLSNTLQQSITDLKEQKADFQNQLTQAINKKTELETKNEINEKRINDLINETTNKTQKHRSCLWRWFGHG